MNNGVDVLKVMDEYEELLDFASLHYGAWVSDGRGAFVASAHVIESLENSRKAREVVDEVIQALELALSSIEETVSEMTVGDRFTNAGQSLLDALIPCRNAVAKAKGQ